MASPLLQVDTDLLRRFEDQLDPLHPEVGKIPARVLGYGEISTVLEINGDGRYAYKRMPLFASQAELDAYQRVYVEYNRLLTEEIGLRLPAYGFAGLVTASGRWVAYAVQEKLDPASIGNRLIHRLSTADVQRLVRQLLADLARVWRFNQSQTRVQVGLDGQISNWSVVGLDPYGLRLNPAVSLRYVDTSTPLFRVDGQEQLHAELFLRSAPSFLAWILRRFVLADVVNRYYDLHRVTVDLVANFYKEQLPDLIPGLVETINDFFAHEVGDLPVAPLSAAEVRAYYREDALIWRFYLGARRIDRFLHRRLLRREYPYILPIIRQR